jgi:hypothetical protein
MLIKPEKIYYREVACNTRILQRPVIQKGRNLRCYYGERGRLLASSCNTIIPSRDLLVRNVLTDRCLRLETSN